MIWELSRLISKSIQKLPVKCFFGRKRGGSPMIGDPPGICDIFTKCVHLVSQRITPHFHVSLNHRYIRLSISWMTPSFEASLPLNITLLPSNQLPIAALKAFPPPLACWRLQHVGSPRRPQLMRHLLMIFFWPAHNSQANGHSNNRWEQSSSTQVHRKHSTEQDLFH